MSDFNLDVLTAEELKEAREKAGKIGFMTDYSRTLEIEYENDNKIALVELMLFAPIKLIAKKLFLKYINENYELLMSIRILNEEEEELLKKFHNNFDFALEFIDWQISQYQNERLELKEGDEGKDVI